MLRRARGGHRARVCARTTGPGTLDVFGKAGALDARIHYLDRLRAIPLAVTRLLAIKDLWLLRATTNRSSQGNCPLAVLSHQLHLVRSGLGTQ